MGTAALWIAAGLVGLSLGSYVVTAALRAAGGEQSFYGRSHCDVCDTPLGYAQTLPVVSFLWLRGRCALCDGAIDRTHFWGEIGGGIIVLSSLSVALPGRAALLAALGLVLMASAAYDLKTRKLPNYLTLVAAALSAILAWSRSSEAVLIGAVAAALSFALLEGVRRAFLQLRRQPGLGSGDVKLLAALALWTGIATPWAVALAALLGLGVSWIRPSRDGKLAFGPYIALAAWVVGIGGEANLWPRQ